MSFDPSTLQGFKYQEKSFPNVPSNFDGLEVNVGDREIWVLKSILVSAYNGSAGAQDIAVALDIRDKETVTDKFHSFSEAFNVSQDTALNWGNYSEGAPIGMLLRPNSQLYIAVRDDAGAGFTGSASIQFTATRYRYNQ